MSILYFERRRRSAIAMAAAAADACAQLPHLMMARRYSEILAGLRKQASDRGVRVAMPGAMPCDAIAAVA